MQSNGEELPVHAPNFLRILEEVLDQEDKDYKKSHEYSYRHNPSSAMANSSGKRVGACMRAVWYKAKQTDESNPRPLTAKLAAGFGNAIHSWFAAKLQKSKKLAVVPEAPGRVTVDDLSKEISFRLDGLITHRGELGGLELKTVTYYKMKSMMEKQEYGVFGKDLLQIITYFATNEALNWFGLVYLCRDTGQSSEFHIWKQDEKMYIKCITGDNSAKEITGLSFPEIHKQWKALEKHIDEDTIPKRDFRVVFKDDGSITDQRMKAGYKYTSDKECLYCSWRTLCWTSDGAKEDSIKIGESKILPYSGVEIK